jgi:hypothetical protein
LVDRISEEAAMLHFIIFAEIAKNARIAVLWIRIRNNPNVLAGSESECEKKFGFGYGLGFRHCCRMKFFVKNQKSNT